MKYQNEKLFQLVKTLSRSEKRHFYLFASRSSKSDGKVLRLYKALDKRGVYDEEKLLRTMKGNIRQLANLKVNLCRLLLESLRVQEDSLQPERELHKRMEHAVILSGRGLYQQSLKQLSAIKIKAGFYHQVGFRFQAIHLQTKILSYLNDFSRVKALNEEAAAVNEQLFQIRKLTTFSMLLNRHCQLYGEVLNEGHLAEIEKIHHQYYTQPSDDNFYARLNFFQGLCWYSFLKKEFANYYRYATMWHELFTEFPQMKVAEKLQYLKGQYFLQDACFVTGQCGEHERMIELLHQPSWQTAHTNNKEAFLYSAIARINYLLLHKKYKESAEEGKSIEAAISSLNIKQPGHVLLELWYKMARLYFYAANYENTIGYCNNILNEKNESHFDLQCSSRFLHLMSHFYCANFRILESLARSCRRFIETRRPLKRREAAFLLLMKKSGIEEKPALVDYRNYFDC